MSLQEIRKTLVARSSDELSICEEVSVFGSLNSTGVVHRTSTKYGVCKSFKSPQAIKKDRLAVPPMRSFLLETSTKWEKYKFPEFNY